jgi:hypothetical protein
MSGGIDEQASTILRLHPQAVLSSMSQICRVRVEKSSCFVSVERRCLLPCTVRPSGVCQGQSRENKQGIVITLRADSWVFMVVKIKGLRVAIGMSNEGTIRIYRSNI